MRWTRLGGAEHQVRRSSLALELATKLVSVTHPCASTDDEAESGKQAVHMSTLFRTESGRVCPLIHVMVYLGDIAGLGA